MKKVLALVLLFAVNAAAVFILIVINLFLVYSPAFPVALINAAAASFGISCLYVLFKRNAVSRNVFWLVTYLPVLVYEAYHLVNEFVIQRVVLHRFCIGVSAVLMYYDIPITCGIYGLFGTGWLIVCNVIAKRKALK